MDVIVFGVGQLAEVVGHYLDNHSDLTVAGYTVDPDFLPTEPEFRGKPVVPWDRIAQDFPPDRYQLIGPVSYRDNNRFRRDRYLEGKAMGYRFASFIHPTAQVETPHVGENSVILEECTVQPFSRLGVCSILWSKVHIGHHARIGDYCFMASFCGIAGNVRVGDCVFFGGMSGVTDNLTVGSDCIVGADTVVTRDLADGALAAARGIRVIEGGARRFGKRLLG
ncbi:hypothetical protein [Aestuariicoccus sp. MJ-SS9]|uniref:hypothetical protein n=1 Tax=Aestuariicoccus sp. MJ-SS9 TaxID=3079855 RepID=UPI0029075F7C|nr:hypothetical protein [Aestuariicoccus sp. MJ-SS9]MDU8909791.1 hypothetical protein [Aestuariicoccus sp. MJ-SS9]